MSGGKKKQGQVGQKHQNKTAFKIQFNPLALEIHKKVSFRGLCKRCADQITWKLQYNKYKRMTEPARCTLCQQKSVLRTYMSACEACSETLRICPKCLDPESEEQVEVKLTEKEQRLQDEENERKMNEFLKTLKERSRRTVKRLYEKGTITWNAELSTFTDEQGNTLPLQFRQGYGSKNLNGEDEDEEIDEFGDEDDEGEEQEEQHEESERQGAEEGHEEDHTENKKQNNKNKASKEEKKIAPSKPSEQNNEKEEQDEEQNEEDQQHDSQQDGEQQHEQEEDESQQPTEEKENKQVKPKTKENDNENDWEDVEEDNQDKEGEEGEEDQDEQSEEEQQAHKKKRKLSSHKRHHRHHK